MHNIGMSVGGVKCVCTPVLLPPPHLSTTYNSRVMSQSDVIETHDIEESYSIIEKQFSRLLSHPCMQELDPYMH